MTNPSPPPDPRAPEELAERLQARLELLDAQPALADGASRGNRPAAHGTFPGSVDHTTPAIADLEDQLDILRSQLDVAFAGVEDRIVAAEARAEAAEARAQEASLQMSRMLAALDEFSTELAPLARRAVNGDSAEVSTLRAAISRLRGRLPSA